MLSSTDMQKDEAVMDMEETGVLDTGGDESPSSVYEIGYHIIPTVSEDELPKEVNKLMDLLKAEKAAMVGERFPSKIDLAYPIAKRTAGKRTNYSSAYFGWVAFEVPRESILKIKAALDTNASVLRFIILSTSRDAVAAAMSGAVSLPTAPTPTGNIEKPKRAEEVGGEMSEAALDQALETMVSEDAKAAE